MGLRSPPNVLRLGSVNLEAHAIATTLTSQEFSQDTRAARTAALRGPVFIIEEGQVGHVLLCMEDYRRLISERGSLADALMQPGADFDFDPPRLGLRLGDLRGTSEG